LNWRNSISWYKPKGCLHMSQKGFKSSCQGQLNVGPASENRPWSMVCHHVTTQSTIPAGDQKRSFPPNLPSFTANKAYIESKREKREMVYSTMDQPCWLQDWNRETGRGSCSGVCRVRSKLRAHPPMPIIFPLATDNENQLLETLHSKIQLKRDRHRAIMTVHYYSQSASFY
jgi:hypothetical protein